MSKIAEYGMAIYRSVSEGGLRTIPVLKYLDTVSLILRLEDDFPNCFHPFISAGYRICSEIDGLHVGSQTEALLANMLA